jgi:hypothetical protein
MLEVFSRRADGMTEQLTTILRENRRLPSSRRRAWRLALPAQEASLTITGVAIVADAGLHR